MFTLQIVQEYPEITKPKFYRFLIYLPDASEYEVLSVLESLRTQYPNFRSTVWSKKLDADTKAKKFGSLGYRNIPKGGVYKLGDRHVLKKKVTPATDTNFQTRHFKDVYLDGKVVAHHEYKCLQLYTSIVFVCLFH